MKKCANEQPAYAIVTLLRSPSLGCNNYFLLDIGCRGYSGHIVFWFRKWIQRMRAAFPSRLWIHVLQLAGPWQLLPQDRILKESESVTVSPEGACLHLRSYPGSASFCCLVSPCLLLPRSLLVQSKISLENSWVQIVLLRNSFFEPRQKRKSFQHVRSRRRNQMEEFASLWVLLSVFGTQLSAVKTIAIPRVAGGCKWKLFFVYVCCTVRKTRIIIVHMIH